MAQAVSRLTYSDYQLLPDDGKRYEIIEGELYMTPAPATRHQLIVGRLTQALMNYLDIHPIGTVLTAPADVLLSETDVVQPDLLFVHNDSQAQITEKNIQGVPDLVVEILSESSRKTDEIIKRKLYERYQVQEYWIVDPELENIKIYRQADQGYTRTAELSTETHDAVTSALFPNWTLPLTQVFGNG